MSDKDPNEIVKIEKAIAKKYGEEAIQNPKKYWTDDKEKQYLEQQRDLYYKSIEEEDLDKTELNGVFIPKKLLNKDSNRSCPVCQTYSFDTRDNVYMTKYTCCRKCYITYVEGREERWATGWRPNKGENK